MTLELPLPRGPHGQGGRAVEVVGESSLPDAPMIVSTFGKQPLSHNPLPHSMLGEYSGSLQYLRASHTVSTHSP